MTEPGNTPERPLATQDEGLPTGKIAIVGTVTLIIFAIAVFLMDRMRAGRDDALPEGPRTVPASIGKPEVGIVDQELFELENRAQLERQNQRQRLGSYGWVDRDAGVIHIPIEKAMERVAQEQW